VTDRPTRPDTAHAERGEDDGLEALTDEILPALVARLRASRLAELEVRSDGWRVRLRRDSRAPRRPPRTGPDAVGSREAPDDQPEALARSPAVGYFTPTARLAVGESVQAGDQIGSVDVLGISLEVTAPLGGVVSAVLAEPGQAVEYGQPLAEIDPMAAALAEAGDDESAVDSAADVAAAPPATDT
jgi:acetyl-CoA carboxylase biotin carboxyl carrier protein